MASGACMSQKNLILTAYVMIMGSSRFLAYFIISINYILWNGQFSFVVSDRRVSYSSLSISHYFHALQQCETPCEREHPFHMISTGFSHNL